VLSGNHEWGGSLVKNSDTSVNLLIPGNRGREETARKEGRVVKTSKHPEGGKVPIQISETNNS